MPESSGGETYRAIVTNAIRRHQWGIFRDDAGFAHSGCLCKDLTASRDYPGHVADAVLAAIEANRAGVAVADHA